MATWRKLHTKIVESLDVNDMPDDFTRLAWAFLPLGLDKEGRCLDNPSFVKAKIMPLRDDVHPERMKEALDWFADRGMIVRYEVAGRAYFYVPKFREYQGDTSRECKSNYPAPQDQNTQTSCNPHADYTENACKGHVNVAQTSRTEADVEANANANADVDAAADTEQSARSALLAAAAGPDRGNGDLETPPECAVCLGAVARKAEVLGLQPKRARQVCLERGPRFAAMWVEEITSRRYLDAREPLEGGRQRVQNPAGLLVEMVRTGSDPPEPGASSWVWEICCASGECLPGEEA